MLLVSRLQELLLELLLLFLQQLFLLSCVFCGVFSLFCALLSSQVQLFSQPLALLRLLSLRQPLELRFQLLLRQPLAQWQFQRKQRCLKPEP